LGGSGQMNYFLHALGIPDDYDEWVKMGAHDWNYERLEPFVESVFNNDDEKVIQFL
jgi:choline dehydrogenase-like flavoprotein